MNLNEELEEYNNICFHCKKNNNYPKINLNDFIYISVSEIDPTSFNAKEKRFSIKKTFILWYCKGKCFRKGVLWSKKFIPINCEYSIKVVIQEKERIFTNHIKANEYIMNILVFEEIPFIDINVFITCKGKEDQRIHYEDILPEFIKILVESNHISFIPTKEFYEFVIEEEFEVEERKKIQRVFKRIEWYHERENIAKKYYLSFD